MRTLVAKFRILVGALALLALTIAAQPASAQQPKIGQSPRERGEGRAAPARAQDDLRALARIPDKKSYTIEQPAGRDWRHFHEVTLRWIGGVAILGILAVLVVFYLWRGMVRIESGRSGRTHRALQRLRTVRALDDGNLLYHPGGERPQHHFRQAAAVATDGPGSLHRLVRSGRSSAHNYLSFPFTLGVILIFFMWLAGNIPNKVDVEWFKRGRRHRRARPSPRLSFQRRPEGDLLDRGARRHCGVDQRLCADVPVLRHGYPEHAERSDRTRRSSPCCLSPP